MDINNLHFILTIIQKSVSLCGVLVILTGVLIALGRYIHYTISSLSSIGSPLSINTIRLSLGRVLILGLEFIVAADLIGTTTAPDYYTVGIVAIIVVIRIILSYALNREINSIDQKENDKIS
ncbi:DUF1622 domain-containing protein [Legionella jamestowniensis]|uniref:DUF1622 domain-containing protein n=1 Tax=Legionella jamestowniensis TaxID=455 RepID=A0A0W0UTQ4_9GAMM|nr:DUF1622 domain-containing protein [Legionella jamestowniensis]KTD11231.1 hypothetical protein Ljam_0425 [Legionella jamestowniensis]OCH98090.1 hypothetical protein A8135_13090 [Legionella jamestowniensis]SFL70251.1 Uncharacterized membrane protein [Legionella jamestowniensis DSM 19215]